MEINYLKLQKKKKLILEYEAAVCGGVPIIRSIKEGLIANKIHKVYGIFNGTSNYILSSMDQNKLQFKNVLIKAQKLGYAENNPASDYKRRRCCIESSKYFHH